MPAIVAITTTPIAQREIVPPPPAPAQPPPSSLSNLAFVQLAVYNAVVTIEGGYEPYGRPLRPQPGASVDAGVFNVNLNDGTMQVEPPVIAEGASIKLAAKVCRRVGGS